MFYKFKTSRSVDKLTDFIATSGRAIQDCLTLPQLLLKWEKKILCFDGRKVFDKMLKMYKL